MVGAGDVGSKLGLGEGSGVGLMDGGNVGIVGDGVEAGDNVVGLAVNVG